MGWRDNVRRERHDDERRAEARAMEASTLSHASRPFTQGKVIWGSARATMEAAYEELLVQAHELGYDAVLGVGFTSPAHPPGNRGAGYSTVNIVAYGTGVHWTGGED